MQRSLHIGVFDTNLIMQASPYCGDRVFYKGFLANGYQSFLFDYRANQQPNEGLIKYAKEIEPTLFFFGKCELIYPETIRQLRILFPKAIFCKWAADVRDKPTPHDLGHLKYIDKFVATYGGKYLKLHADAMPLGSKAMSIITFTDSEYYKYRQIDMNYKTDILWSGRRCTGDNVMRDKVIDQLLEYKQIDEFYNIKLFGIDEEWIGDPEYVNYINGTKIGVGINSFNQSKYSSDRLGNYMSCGTFYLAHYFEGIEKVFKRGEHLDWFYTLDEFKEKIEYYLEHDKIREKIASVGQRHVLKHFDTKPLVTNILHFIQTGASLYDWDDIYYN